MKKIISTQGLSYGEFTDENLSVAIQERVCPRLERCFSQYSGEEIHAAVSLSFTVMSGEVKSLHLSFTIDHPTHDQLSYFRDTCNIFFDLDDFIVNYEEDAVSISAYDIYDIGRLAHALEVMTVSLESILCVADEKDIDVGAIYSPNGFTIIQVPNVPKYRIKEGTIYMAPVHDGVEEIDSFIFCGCKTYVVLSIPRSVRIIGDNLFGNGGHIEIRDK